MARRSTPEPSRARFYSDSSQAEASQTEGKTGGKAENSGTPRSDMVRGWDDLGETHGIAQTS